jgi:tetratricopeptide (TPR) repeat protein
MDFSLVFLRFTGKNHHCTMQLQEAPETWLFKAWPWIETNKIRLAWAAGAVAVVAVGIAFYSIHLDEVEITAGEAASKADMPTVPGTPDQRASEFLNVARDYPQTKAGERAQFQAATALYESGKYTDAETQFESFLARHSGSFFAAEATLGMAASLDAQGKASLAADTYQRVIKSYPDHPTAIFAKLSLAQIDESLGKTNEALALYQQVIQANPNSQTALTARKRAIEMQTAPAKSAAAAPAPAPATQAPFQLTH